MKNPDLQTLLPQVEAIARQAGAEIMKLYGKVSAETKKDGTIVTLADKASEEIILPALEKLTPGMTIISEEQVAEGYQPDISGGSFWTVDPLDGTNEFKNQTDGFAVAISLVIDHKVVLGVLFYPSQDLLYSACGPGTAIKDENGVRRSFTAVQSPPSENIQVLTNDAHADMPRIEGHLSAQFGKAAKITRRPGTDATCVCLVAENKADMAVICSAKRQGRKYWWDVAPGHAIAEAAGAQVQDWNGQPLVYDAQDLQVPPYIVASLKKSALKPRSP